MSCTLFVECSYVCTSVHAGLPESVTSGGVSLKGAGGWEEVVRDGSAGSFFYDKEQQVLWVRLVQGMNATITLN